MITKMNEYHLLQNLVKLAWNGNVYHLSQFHDRPRKIHNNFGYTLSVCGVANQSEIGNVGFTKYWIHER